MKVILDNIQVKAVTSWLPETSLNMLSLAEYYGEKQVTEIINTTGIERVRIANKDVCSSDMCQYAAKALMEREDVDKGDIDGLVFVSQTADYITPATSVSLQDRLGLSNDTVCIDIRYGCSGYIYGLFQASLWVSTGACRNVLLLAGDTSSRMVNENDRSLRMVFGDAGTATLVSTGDKRIGFHIQSDGSGADRLIIPAGGFRTPISEETSKLEWDDDNNGRTKNDMYMDGMAIFNFAITKVPKNIKGLLELMAWDKDEVGLYALHQANKFMVDFVGKKLKADKNIVPVNCRDFGNTGPSTIPLLLSDICSREHSYNLAETVMCGFGVGLSWGSAATDLTDTHFYSPINK